MIGFRHQYVLLAITTFLCLGFTFFRNDKTISGLVMDCQTNNPIAKVQVTVNQRGWGRIKGQLVWDKDYIYKSVTDDSGYFKITYQVGSSAHIRAKKNGYLIAEQWEEPGEDIIIKMLKGDNPKEITYDCNLLSDCIKSEMKGEVEVFTNVCQRAK